MRGEGCVGGVGNEPTRAGESIDDCWGGDRKWEGAGGLSGSAGEGRERAKDVIIDDRGPLIAPSGRRLHLLLLLERVRVGWGVRNVVNLCRHRSSRGGDGRVDVAFSFPSPQVVPIGRSHREDKNEP